MTLVNRAIAFLRGPFTTVTYLTDFSELSGSDKNQALSDRAGLTKIISGLDAGDLADLSTGPFGNYFTPAPSTFSKITYFYFNPTGVLIHKIMIDEAHRAHMISVVPKNSGDGGGPGGGGGGGGGGTSVSIDHSSNSELADAVSITHIQDSYADLDIAASASCRDVSGGLINATHAIGDGNISNSDLLFEFGHLHHTQETIPSMWRIDHGFVKFFDGLGTNNDYHLVGDLNSWPTWRSDLGDEVYAVGNEDIKQHLNVSGFGSCGSAINDATVAGPVGCGTDNGLDDDCLNAAHDFGMPSGTSILAIAPGIIVDYREDVSGSGGPSHGLGNFVTVLHNPKTSNAFYATYAHLRENGVVAEGGNVVEGQLLGYFGETGFGTGPHLHLQFGTTSFTHHSGDTLAYAPDSGDTLAYAPDAGDNLIDFGGVWPADKSSVTESLPPVVSDNAGNSIGMATAISLGSTVAGSVGVGADTDDYFRFTATANDTVTARPSGMSTDIDLRTYNGSSSQIAASTNGGSTADQVSFNVTAGQTYYLRTDPYGAVSSNYSLATSFSPSTPVDTSAPMVVGYSPADNSSGVAIGANLTLTFNEAICAGSGNIVIYNANGTVWQSFSTTDSSQVSFSGSTVTINPGANLTPGASYYVTVGNGAIRDAAGSNFSGFSSSSLLNFTTASAPVVSDNAGNSIGAATAISLGSTVTGAVGVGADTDDYFRFTATANGTVTARLHGLSADIDLYTYNGSSSQIAASTNGGSTADQVSFNVTAGQTYYLRADPYGAASSNYTLATSFTPSTPVSTGRADLIIETSRIDDRTVKPGQEVRLDWDARNVGSGAPASSDTFIFLSHDRNLSSDDRYLDRESLGSISVGELDCEYESFTMPTNSARGTYYPAMVTDAGLDIAESNEANNIAWVQFDLI